MRAIPRLLVLTAPAGYGKTALAFEYAKAFKGAASIDLSRTQSVPSLLLALLKILSFEQRDNAFLRQTQLAVAADDSVPPLLVERVLDAWREPGAPGVIVFDNAGSLPSSMLPLFNEIVVQRPGYRVCVVCSDTPLSPKICTFLSSAGMMALGADDLALTQEQTHELFADLAISPEELQAVFKAARGWPLLTLLLRQLQSEGRLKDAIALARQAADRDRVYALVQRLTIESLPERERRVLEFCAIVPDVTIDDVRSCLDWQDAQALQSVANAIGLIRIEGKSIHVNPLLSTTVAAGNQQAMDDLRAAARAAFRRHDYESAAQRYIACGDRDEAGKLLDDMLEHGATAAAASLAVLLGANELERHPRWYTMATFLRRFDEPPAQSLERIQSRRRLVEASGDEAAQFASAAAETALLLHCGSRERAQERLRELDAFVGSLRRGGIMSALRAHVAGRFADTLRGALAVAACEMDRGEQLLKRAPFALGQYPLISLGAVADGWLPIGLFRGDVQLIRHHCERIRESLTRAGMDMVLLDLDANQAFAGWVLGDELMYRQSIARVAERAPMYRMRALDHFLSCAGMRPETEPTGVEPLRRLIIAHLLAAGRKTDGDGLQHAQSALRFAREFHQPLYVTLAGIAVRERGGEPALTRSETVEIARPVERAFLERLRSPDPHSS